MTKQSKGILLAWALLSALTLTSCNGQSSQSGKQRMEIPSGIFSWQLVQAYDAACSINGGTENLWENGVEGTDTETWILEQAKSYSEEYLAVEQKFEESGIKLRAEEEETISGTVERYWNELGYGRYYSDYNVTEEDFRATLEHSAKIDVLYGEARSELRESVSEQDVLDYANENSVLVQYIAVPHSAGMPDNLTEQEKQAWMDTDQIYDRYCSRLASGAKLEDLVKEVSENLEQQAVGIGSSYQDGVAEELFFWDSTSLSSGFVEALREAPVGEVVYFDDVAQDYQIIFAKQEFTAGWEGLTRYTDSVTEAVTALKFAEQMSQWGQEVELSNGNLPNAAAVKKMFGA